MARRKRGREASSRPSIRSIQHNQTNNQPTNQPTTLYKPSTTTSFTNTTQCSRIHPSIHHGKPPTPRPQPRPSTQPYGHSGNKFATCRQPSLVSPSSIEQQRGRRQTGAVHRGCAGRFKDSTDAPGRPTQPPRHLRGAIQSIRHPVRQPVHVRARELAFVVVSRATCRPG